MFVSVMALELVTAKEAVLSCVIAIAYAARISLGHLTMVNSVVSRKIVPALQSGAATLFSTTVVTFIAVVAPLMSHHVQLTGVIIAVQSIRTSWDTTEEVVGARLMQRHPRLISNTDV